MRDITWRCGRTIANDQISLRVDAGEVHAIVGENGAGKSTLMKILAGVQPPDIGGIAIHGREVKFHSPADAIAAGIGMVHQHFMLIPPFTVAENIILGKEETRGGLINLATAAIRTRELAREYQIDVDPNTSVSDLSVGQQQRVEILKVLYRSAKIIILDEPTAVLTPQEVEDLFVTIRRLRDSGKTIILITHKLTEVMNISNRVTVLRSGRNVATLNTEETSPTDIARLMIGRDVILPTLARELDLEKKPFQEVADSAKNQGNSHPVLSLQGVSLQRRRAAPLLSDITLDVFPGEIVGIAGVEGNGQAELVELICGMRLPDSGIIRIAGQNVTHVSPREKFAAGLACIPEDRHRKGMVLPFTLRENLLLGRHHSRLMRKAFSPEKTLQLLREFDVRPDNPKERAVHLSGGNQQKLIVAREFTRDAAVIVASQPTRGIDLGAIEFIHEKLIELRRAGKGILLISAELSEVLALSDRVVVMYRGRIVYSAINKGLTEHDLGIWMAGGNAANG